ncbi:MAG: hypothetical protein V4684_06175 [Pseudomonadota bacterium]
MDKFEYLDELANRIAAGDVRGFHALSSGEKCYVALAANNQALLEEDGYTIVQAFVRLDADWRVHLLTTWRYASVQAFARPEWTSARRAAQ